ncbi:MAG: helix-turn-helix transcriptional regulator, partial [Peptococcaceae bacterium]|nr:helix-turn-helix transcriptional regulator [Peptococcaceae bacterium]
KERSFSEQCAYLESQLYRLTPAERVIYDLYLDGMGTKEILVQLNITQNTLKYHNKNIYSKLGVSSRKELVALAKALEDDTRV